MFIFVLLPSLLSSRFANKHYVQCLNKGYILGNKKLYLYRLNLFVHVWYLLDNAENI